MAIALILLFSFFAGYFVWFGNQAMKVRKENAAHWQITAAKMAND